MVPYKTNDHPAYSVLLRREPEGSCQRGGTFNLKILRHGTIVKRRQPGHDPLFYLLMSCTTLLARLGYLGYDFANRRKGSKYIKF